MAFLLFTAIGTISHEYGHIWVAKALGYKTSLHYGSMEFDNPTLIAQQQELYATRKTAIEHGNHFEHEAEYEHLTNRLRQNEFLILLGGPLQTMLTGLFGLSILFFRRKNRSRYQLRFIDWLAVFLSLFWLRQVFNLVLSVSKAIISSGESYFGGDEKKLSELLNLWPGSFSVVLACVGLFIALFVVFRIVPQHLRPTFIISGLVGGTSGFILWMQVLGPQILP